MKKQRMEESPMDTLRKRARARAAPETRNAPKTIRSKDRGQLSIQIDLVADNLPELMLVTRRQKNEALAQGQLDTADDLDDCSITLSAQYGILVRHEIKEIDDSDEMRRVIEGFAKVNQFIETAINDIRKLTEYVEAAKEILGALEELIKRALVA